MPPRVPPLAVVMPVRNAGRYLDAAMQSIAAQTLSDFEFVVLDDASTDGSSERLAEWASRDPRVRVLRSEHPLGAAGSSEAAVRASRAPLVARMDADDLAHPERLARQAAVFDRAADVVLVGTGFDGIDASGERVRSRDRWRLLRASPFSPFPHGSVMFRRSAFEAAGGYRRQAEYWEDLDLFRRLAGQGRIVVLPEVLYRYRYHGANTCTREQHATITEAKVRMRAAVGADAPADDPLLLYSIAASRLWAGDDPELWARLRWRRLLTADPRVIAIFMVAGTAALDPRAARFVLATLIAWRDRLAGVLLGQQPREWRFGS